MPTANSLLKRGINNTKYKNYHKKLILQDIKALMHYQMYKYDFYVYMFGILIYYI